MVTATDLFCGAGGSSTGIKAAGAEVLLAANHWRLAIETHATNHPTTDHDCADLRATHPSLYPRTDILWASPECTNHSLAKGRRRKLLHQLDLWGEERVDPAEERSRATMREVVEFAAYHQYPVVIVENVVDIRHWAHYDSWIAAMHNLGYDHRALYLNAQFMGVPQSRDRIYVVFWKRGNRAPDLDFCPTAHCDRCGDVQAVQSWKSQRRQWGRYGKNGQYLYCCPTCGQVVRPAHTPAWMCIDWSLPAERIGDRARPLKAKTLQRIRVGIQKFARPVVIDTSGWGVNGSGYTMPVDGPLNTQTTRQSFALVCPPFLSSQHDNHDGTSTRVRSLDDPLPCVTTMNNEQQLVVPPFQLFMQAGLLTDPLDEPLHTVVASATQTWLVHPPLVASYYGAAWTYASVDEPTPTITTVQRQALIVPDEVIDATGFRMLEPHELKAGMSFPEDYIVLGNKREQVRQIGNAVCANVAQWIAERAIQSLAS